jgi:cytochrome c peroxidase
VIRKIVALLILSAAWLPAQDATAVSDMGEEDGLEEAADGALPEHERAELIVWLRAQYQQSPEKWPAPTLDAGIVHREIGAITEPPPAPVGNPTTPEKARLGLSLFFDARLSGSQQISCASCHEPQLGWSNGAAFASGVHRQRLRRNPPTLAGAGYAKTLFLDGRVASLEEQAEAVLLNPMEMDGEPAQIVERLEKAGGFYGPLFEKAFGSVEVTFQRVLEAIAAFQRSIRVGNTRFDKFVKGDHAALDDSELAGLHLFRTKARCVNCHMGPMFTVSG